MKQFSWLWLLALVGFCGPFASAPVAQEGLSTALLEAESSIALSYEPDKVEFSSDASRLYVTETTRGSSEVGTVHVYAANGALAGQETLATDVPHSIDAMAPSWAGHLLYVVGTRDGLGYLSEIATDRPESAVRTISLNRDFGLPTVATSESGVVYVGDASSSAILRLNPELFAAGGGSEVGSEKGRQLFHGGGTRALAVSDLNKLVFVSANDRPRLSAVDLPTGFIINEVSREGRSYTTVSGDPLPYAMEVTQSLATKQDQASISFLLADHQSRILTLTDFDNRFQTLQVVASAPLGHNLVPSSQIEFVPGKSLLKQPMIVSADPQQKTILVGNLHSRDVLQFTRGTLIRSLELVGRFALAELPSDIVVSPRGDEAIASLRSSRALVRLSLGSGEVGQGAEADKFRALQRALTDLGYYFGAIDGMHGPATRDAILAFQKSTDVEFDGDDIDAALDAVTPRPISAAALAMIASFEGFLPVPYNDPSNYCVIGYGHIVAIQPCEKINLREFAEPLSEEQALDLLDRDLVPTRRAVDRLVPTTLSDDQFGALVSLVSNVGIRNFNTSSLLRHIQAGDMEEAALEFRRWVRVQGQFSPGLEARRTCEEAMFRGSLHLEPNAPFDHRSCN